MNDGVGMNSRFNLNSYDLPPATFDVIRRALVTTIIVHHPIHTYTSRTLLPSQRHSNNSSMSLRLIPLIRSTRLTSSTPRSPRRTLASMSPPAKKMAHFAQINSIPAEYPNFRTVLWTGESSQLVVMTVPVKGEIGEEVSSGVSLLFWSYLHTCVIGARPTPGPPCRPTPDLHFGSRESDCCRGRKASQGRRPRDCPSRDETQLCVGLATSSLPASLHLVLDPLRLLLTSLRLFPGRSRVDPLTAPVINTGPTPLCLFTVYAPAEHAEDTVHKTKAEGDKAEDAGKDEAPGWASKGKK